MDADEHGLNNRRVSACIGGENKTLRNFAYFVFIFIPFILTGCWTPTGKQNPVEVVSYGATGGAGGAGMHSMLAGDTVYTVSQRYNLPLRDIITVNNLSAPYQLPLNYRLKLPPPNEYRVKEADTLNRISRMYNVSVSEMAKLNNLSSPYVLKKGQILRLPSPQPKLEEEFAAAPPSPKLERAMAMRPGAVESEALAPPPGTTQTAAVTPPPQTAQTPAAAKSFPPQPAAKPAQVQTVAAKQPNIAPKVPARSGNGKFMRPIDGKTISKFGPKDDGLHNDGINIKAAKGTPVRAAENGVVAYVGNEMQGYGNLILVRHQDRWMTAYAHMDKTLVKKGDVVKVGQSIGTVGSTGGVDSPQLHFEVRRGTEAMNPDLYL